MSDRHVTLITGASKGIGRAAAERLAGQGHLVIGLARNEPDGMFPSCRLTNVCPEPHACPTRLYFRVVAPKTRSAQCGR